MEKSSPNLATLDFEDLELPGGMVLLLGGSSSRTWIRGDHRITPHL